MIKHIFFDLDRTIWDFQKNTEATLTDIYNHFQLDKNFASFAAFSELYHQINDEFWAAYREGKIDKTYLIENRYTTVLQRIGVDDKEKGKAMGEFYIKESPYQSHLFPHAHEVLKELSKHYQLHIITNGFAKVQHTKISYSKLDNYFKTIVCSDEVGVNKPDPKIFNFALQNAGAEAANSVMIGDDFQGDVIGAENVGMKGILFDPNKKHGEITAIKTVKDLAEIPGLIPFC